MNNDSAGGLKVWTLMYLSINNLGHTRPMAIPCSSYLILQKHVCDILRKNLDMFETKYREVIAKSIEAKDYEFAISQWRHAQQDNERPIPFDMYWDERPEIVL